MQGDSTLRKVDCRDIIFEGETGGGYNCLSEEDKRQYCERLVEKVLQEYPHLSAHEIMVRLGYVCEEVPVQSSDFLTRDRCITSGRNQQKSTECDPDRRKALYAETLCQQVLLENPHFLPSKVKAAVRNLLNIVPEVVDAANEGITNCNNSSSPPSLTVELSQSDCKAHNTAFDLIMEDILGTRNVCGDIEASNNRRCKPKQDPCDDPQYKKMLEKSRQQIYNEKKAQTEAELAYKWNCYLTEICKNINKEGEKERSYGRTSKPPKMTFADRNPCKEGCDNYTNGDSEFSSSLPKPGSYRGLPTSEDYNMSPASLGKARSKKNAPSPCYDKGNAKSAFWESNPCNVACDAWGTNGISAGDFKFSVPPRLYGFNNSGRPYDPMYMTPGFKTPNVASYGTWKDPLSGCCANAQGRPNLVTSTPFQCKNSTGRGKSTFAERNPCTIWDPFCGSRNVPRYGAPSPNYQRRKLYTMPPCYPYRNQRPYAPSRVQFPGINRYC